MKIKEGFLLRKMGKEYIAVAIGEAGEQFGGIINLNEAGEYLWKELEKGITEEELVAKMLERYEDLDEATAREDLGEFLKSIEVALEQ